MLKRIPPVRSVYAPLGSGLLLAALISFNVSVADTVSVNPAAAYPVVRTILSTGRTIAGELIKYPTGAPALVTAVEIVLEPGQQTGWHTHPVPLVGYLLSGELTVDYGPNGQRTYRPGDALVEAMHEPHNGRNMGQDRVRILAIFIGIDGVQGSLPASPPGR